jgi:outer membrane protein assembly factor BamA/autotransporter translocation and assembly factor TamB
MDMAEPFPNTGIAPRRGRRVLRWLAIAVLVLLALLAGGIAALQTPPAREYVLGKVTELLAAQEISFGTDEFSYNLLDLSADLRNVRVQSARMPDAPAFLTADRARLDISLRQILRGRYVVESADIANVRLHYFVDENGVDNLPRPPANPDDPGEPIDYLIANLDVPAASVRYENRQQRIDLSIPSASLTVNGSAATDRHAIAIEAPGGDATHGERQVRLDTISAVLDLGRDDVVINRADAAAEGARVHLTGTMGPFADPVADFVVRAEADAARVAAVAALEQSIGGAVSIEATAKGPLAAMVLDGRAAGTGVRYGNLAAMRLDAAATYDMGAKHLRLAHARLDGPAGKVDAHGEMALEGLTPSRLGATVQALDTAAVMSAFAAPYRVASRVDGTVNATWPGRRYVDATGDATISLTPSAPAAVRSMLPVGGRLTASARNGRIQARLRNVQAAGATIAGDVTLVDREALSGDLRLHAPDLARAMASAEAFLGRPAGAFRPVAIAGEVQADARLGGRIASPTVDAVVRSESLSIGSAAGIAVDGQLAYAPGAVAVPRLDVAWQEARLHASGVVGLEGRRALEMTVDGDGVQIEGLLQALEQNGVPASGTLALTGRVTGTLDRPLAEARITGHDLAAYNEMLGTLEASVLLADRNVELTTLQLEKPQPDGPGRLLASGSYHLDTQRYTAELGSENLRLVSLSLPGDHAVRGLLEISGRGAGTLAAPAGAFGITASDLEIDGYALGPAGLDTTLADQKATIVAKAGQFGLAARFVVAVERPYPATLEATLNELDLAALPVQLQTPLQGRVRATLTAAAPLSDIGSGSGEATIDALAGSWNRQPFSLDGPGVLRYRDERLEIDRLRLTAQDSSLSVTGNLPLVDRLSPGAIEIDARADLGTLAQYAPAGIDVSGEGLVTLTGSLRGTLEAIDPDLVLTVTDALVLSRDIEPGISALNVRATVARGEANLEALRANWGAASISALARFPLDLLPELPVAIPRKGGPATARLTLDGLDPAAIPGAPDGMTGLISADAEVSAARPALDAAAGQVSFRDLRLDYGGLTLEQRAPSELALNAGTLTVQRFELGGSVGTLAATGTVALAEPRALDLGMKGDLNIAAVSLFADTVQAEGASSIDVTARGTMAAPELHGLMTVSDATLVVDEPTIAAESIDARVELNGDRISLTTLEADVNGGRLTGSGSLVLAGGAVDDLNLEFATRDFAFDAPLDLRSLSDGDVRITRDGDDFVIGGQITIQEAGLTGDINFDTGLLGQITARRQLDLTAERNPLLERTRFNINVDTATPVLVDNNLARAEVTTDLRIVGNPYEPGLLGTLAVLEGGEITLNERRYEVERGEITFLDERRIFPSFDLRLNTTASDYDIAINVSGEPGTTETTLTSEPSLPEPDIMALLVTGRTLDQMRGEEFDVAREQVLSYLTGRIGSTLGRGIERATGLSDVRIEPNLIANETDPSARLTVAQELTDDLGLVYSVDLANSDEQIWIARYDVTRRFQTRAVRQEDNSYRLDFRHDLRRGGRPAPRRSRRVRQVVASVTIPPGTSIAEAELRDELGVEAGKEFDYFAARDAVQDIETLYREHGWVQSRVRLDRAEDGNTVALTLRITEGPRVQFSFSGVTPPASVQEDVRRQWHRGVFDTQRADDASETLQAWLMGENFLQARVSHTIDDSAGDQRRVHFTIEPGPKYTTVMLVFEGAAAIPPDELDEIVNEQGLEPQLFTDPFVVTELLQRYYREQGYLNAEIDKPRYEYEGALARVILTVREGLRFVVGRVATAGNQVFTADQILAELPLAEGEPFLPAAAENALQRIRSLYWARGYNDVIPQYGLTVDRLGGRVMATFTIEEGRQSVVQEIRIAGNEKTSDRLVREQLVVKPAEPLNLQELSRSRRNLYQSGAFSLVDITRRDAETAAGEPPANGDDTGAAVDPVAVVDNGQPGAGSGQKPVVLEVAVREVQPHQFRYGASYDTEGGLGGIIDASAHNTFGKARVLGLSGRYDRRISEARAYLNQPSLLHWPIQTTAAVYYRRERNVETQLTEPFNVDRQGISIQQERELANRYVWTYGYRFERSRTYDPRTGVIPDEMTAVSPLTSTFLRETRDDVLDATQGSFTSHAFSYSPGWLGSDVPFIRYYGQYSTYFPLRQAQRRRFSSEVERPRLVFATAVRLGLARGSGELLPQSERFFAGGSTTLRGFEQNAVGPVGPTRLALGGDALFLLNNELRFPLVGKVDGVTFVDIGNVFQRINEFSLTDLRKSAGAGLRLRTPWFLVRGDYGLVLDRRAGERRGRFYFSIGQAF